MTQFDSFLASKGLKLRTLDEDHYASTFDCGRDDKMTKWFCDTAGNWHNEGLCTVWVMSPLDNDSAVYGFFTLSAHQITPSNVARRQRAADLANKSWVNGLNHPFPAQLLGKFALDKDQQGNGLGSMLMLCVYAKHVEAADVAAAKFLVLDVQHEQLATYYGDRFKFVRSSLPGDTIQMYKATTVIRDTLDAALSPGPA